MRRQAATLVATLIVAFAGAGGAVLPVTALAQPVQPDAPWEEGEDAPEDGEVPAPAREGLLSRAGRAFLMSAILPGAGQWSL
ncbi:MAG TPA: hypothetical protein VNZ57_06385, partial [Longimicrobiales bacterium]|nr:hypothetical protein [Longimicrobiales bacterium]